MSRNARTLWWDPERKNPLDLRTVGLILIIAQLIAIVSLRLELGVFFSLTTAAWGALLFLASPQLRQLTCEASWAIFWHSRIIVFNGQRWLIHWLIGKRPLPTVFQRLFQYSLWSLLVGTTVAGVLITMWQHFPRERWLIDLYLFLCGFVFFCLTVAIRQLSRLVGNNKVRSERTPHSRDTIQIGGLQLRPLTVFFLCLAVSSLLAGWMLRHNAVAIVEQHRRARAIAEIRKLDGSLTPNLRWGREPYDSLSFASPNSITDEELFRLEPSIRRLPDLQEIVLDGTQVTDRGLMHLARWNQNWRRISARNTKISKAGIDDFLESCPNCGVR